MRWQMGRRSDNIEDRRGMPVGRGAAVGGGIGTLVLVLLAVWFGVDPSVVLQGADPGDPRPAPSVQQGAPGRDDQLRRRRNVIGSRRSSRVRPLAELFVSFPCDKSIGVGSSS